MFISNFIYMSPLPHLERKRLLCPKFKTSWVYGFINDLPRASHNFHILQLFLYFFLFFPISPHTALLTGHQYSHILIALRKCQNKLTAIILGRCQDFGSSLFHQSRRSFGKYKPGSILWWSFKWGTCGGFGLVGFVN